MNKRYMLATVMALCCAMGAKTEGADSTAPSDGAAAGASKVDGGGAAAQWRSGPATCLPYQILSLRVRSCPATDPSSSNTEKEPEHA